MGFIPIILTMGGAILLFFMAVNQSLLAKKNSILRLQGEVLDGFRHFGANSIVQAAISSNVIEQIDAGYRQLRTKADVKDDARFESEIIAPYRDLKVTVDQYNRLVSKKPYSFVAKLMGHKSIGK